MSIRRASEEKRQLHARREKKSNDKAAGSRSAFIRISEWNKEMIEKSHFALEKVGVTEMKKNSEKSRDKKNMLSKRGKTFRVEQKYLWRSEKKREEEAGILFHGDSLVGILGWNRVSRVSRKMKMD